MSGISLHKSRETAGIHLQKQGLDIASLPRIRVGVCLDASGSMSDEYSDGHVQNALTHLLGLALHMTNSLDVFVFTERAHQMPHPATEQNYEDYIDRYVAGHVGGGTDYSPVIHRAYQHYFPVLSHLHSAESARQHVLALAHHGHGMISKLFGHHHHETPPPPPPAVNPKSHDPVLMLFLTDGDCSWSDEEPSRHAIHAAADLPLFWSFVGLRHDSRLLRQLAEEADAEFVHLYDGVRISDDDLYRQLITPKLTNWIRQQVR